MARYKRGVTGEEATSLLSRDRPLVQIRINWKHKMCEHVLATIPLSSMN